MIEWKTLNTVYDTVFQVSLIVCNGQAGIERKVQWGKSGESGIHVVLMRSFLGHVQRRLSIYSDSVLGARLPSCQLNISRLTSILIG